MSYISWDRLGQDLVYNANKLRTSIGATAQGAANALFNVISGGSPLGVQTVLFKPHDHGPEGGVPIPRGSHWTMDAGQALDAWKMEIPQAGTPYWIGRNAIPSLGFAGELRRFSSIKDPGPANFFIDIHDGMDSDDTNLLAGSVALEGRCRVYTEPSTLNTLVQVWLYNRTLGQASDIASVTTFGSIVRVSFSDIPVVGGKRNDFIFLVESDVEAIDVSLVSLSICSTRDRSQRASDASFNIETKPKP